MEKNKWESFDIGKIKPKPLVTFTLSKTIRFNGEFIKQFGLKEENASRVRVLFDPTTKEGFVRIGFIFLPYSESSESEPSTLKFSWLPNGNSAFISGHAILTRLGYDYGNLSRAKTKRKFVPYVEDFNDDKIIVIDVPNKKEREVEKESDLE